MDNPNTGNLPGETTNGTIDPNGLETKICISSDPQIKTSIYPELPKIDFQTGEVYDPTMTRTWLLKEEQGKEKRKTQDPIEPWTSVELQDKTPDTDIQEMVETLIIENEEATEALPTTTCTLHEIIEINITQTYRASSPEITADTAKRTNQLIINLIRETHKILTPLPESTYSPDM